MKHSPFALTGGKILLDGFMIWLGLLLAFYIRMVWFKPLGLEAPSTLIPLLHFEWISTKIAIFLLAIMAFHGRYRLQRDEETFLEELTHLFWAFCTGYTLLLVFFFFGQHIFFSRFILGFSWAGGILLLCFGRLGWYFFHQRLLQEGIGKEKILVLGTNETAQKLVSFLKKDPRFDLVGVLEEKKGSGKEFEGATILGTFAQFEKIIEKNTLEGVILAGDLQSHREGEKILHTCHIQGLRFQMVPTQLDVELSVVRLGSLDKQPIITILNTRMMGWGLLTKTIFDYTIAVFGIILISPLLGLIAYKVRKQDKGPIFYKALRVGENGKAFPCYKFRTMVIEADKQKEALLSQNERAGGVFFKMKDDPRITPFGKFLRRTSLDELPQLWNVLRGEMSLIGPRPHLPEEVEQYKNEDRRLIGIKPGVTGFSQVNGLSKLPFKEEIQLELFYLKNWSLWLDAVILFKTIFIVLLRKNET